MKPSLREAGQEKAIAIIRRLVVGVNLPIAVFAAVLSVAGPGIVPALRSSFFSAIGATVCGILGAHRIAILTLLIVSPTLGILPFLKWLPLDPAIGDLNMVMVVVVLVVGVVLFRDYRASRRGAPTLCGSTRP